MSKNTGKEYEKLTQYIFDQIVNQQQVNTIEVQHDVVLQGKSTTHQIDVYWRFEVGGEEYSTIVQAKDWKNKVPQKEMLAFNDIIRDLPYGTKGIFVSQSGYQKGAIEVAKANGITIYELRPPKSSDWAGYIKTVNISIQAKYPVYEDIEISIDEEWLKEHAEITIKNRLRFCCAGEDYLYDEHNVPYITFKELIEFLINQNPDDVKYVEHVFDEDTFAVIGNKYVKIKSIKGNFGYSFSTDSIVIDAEDFVGAILKNVVSGDSKMFDKQYRLKKSDD